MQRDTHSRTAHTLLPRLGVIINYKGHLNTALHYRDDHITQAAERLTGGAWQRDTLDRVTPRRDGAGSLGISSRCSERLESENLCIISGILHFIFLGHS